MEIQNIECSFDLTDFFSQINIPQLIKETAETEQENNG